MSNIKLVETKNQRRLHIGSFFVDLNESDFQELQTIFGTSKTKIKKLTKKEKKEVISKTIE